MHENLPVFVVDSNNLLKSQIDYETIPLVRLPESY